MSDSSDRGWQVQAGSRCRTADPCVNVKNSHRGTETMHTERRKHPRFKVNEGRVWTGRWSSPSVFETSASLVNDLSLGGARVLTSSAPVVGSRRRRIPLNPTGSARQLPDSPGQGPGGSDGQPGELPGPAGIRYLMPGAVRDVFPPGGPRSRVNLRCVRGGPGVELALPE